MATLGRSLVSPSLLPRQRPFPRGKTLFRHGSFTRVAPFCALRLKALRLPSVDLVCRSFPFLRLALSGPERPSGGKTYGHSTFSLPANIPFPPRCCFSLWSMCSVLKDLCFQGDGLLFSMCGRSSLRQAFRPHRAAERLFLIVRWIARPSQPASSSPGVLRLVAVADLCRF